MTPLIEQADLDCSAIQKAAEDLRFLLDRNYPRDASLELVGNRYNLERGQRSLLKRAIFGAEEARRRKGKLVSFHQLAGEDIAVDAYNTLITIESGLLDRRLVMGDDGAVRDIAEISSGYRASEATSKAIKLMTETLAEAKAGEITVVFLSSMSKSSELAADLRKVLEKSGVRGSCRVESAVERKLPLIAEIVATANSAIMEKSQKVFDLAGYIVRKKLKKPAPTL